MIFNFIKPFQLTILLIIVLVFVQIIADLMLPNFMANIVNKGIAKNNTEFIIHTGITMLLVSIAGIICAIGAGFFASKVDLKVGPNLRKSLFSQITNYSLSEFDELGTSSLITRTTNDVTQVQFATFMTLRVFLRLPVICVGAILLAFIYLTEANKWVCSLVYFYL